MERWRTRCQVDFFAINKGLKIAGIGGRGFNPQPKIFVLSQVPMTSQPQWPLCYGCGRLSQGPQDGFPACNLLDHPNSILKSQGMSGVPGSWIFFSFSEGPKLSHHERYSWNPIEKIWFLEVILYSTKEVRLIVGYFALVDLRSHRAFHFLDWKN